MIKLESATPEPEFAPNAVGRDVFRFGRAAIDRVNMEEALTRIDELVARSAPAMVVTVNVDHLIRIQEDRKYARLVGDADLVLADGQPVVWASRLLRRSLPQRVAGSDLVPAMCARAAELGYRVFFLGGEPGAAERAGELVSARMPNLKFVGSYCPPYNFEKDPEECAKALDAVRRSNPDLVFVGLGSPKQEQWIARNMRHYGPAVSVGVGITFSFLAGYVRRAPIFMRRLGLEWLHRLYSEPTRLWRRYLVRGPRFLPLILSIAFRRGANRPTSS